MFRKIYFFTHYNIKQMFWLIIGSSRDFISPSTAITDFFFFFLFYLGLLSQRLTNHRTAGEGRGYFFNSSLPFLPTSRHVGISQAITAENSPHWQQLDLNREPLASENKLLTTKLHALTNITIITDMRELLKHSILEIPIIPQALNINN